jgi:hypothetical protein
MLQTVAQGLGELKNDVAFVGGAVAELYASDPAASEIRPTKDIDCVIELSSRMEHSRLEENLRRKKFAHDTTKGAPICRWIYKGIKVDVMPTDEEILGFNNKWYHDGILNKIEKVLPNGIIIFVFSPEYYLAAKFEAHKDRGGKDLRQSHDFEDIIYILDSCNEILDIVGKAKTPVRIFLRTECQQLLENDGLIEGIQCALPYISGPDRPELIMQLIREITELT